MSYNGSGTFQINTSGQPVVAGTVISSTAFNALTADLATGLSTAITKDGQTTTTARIPFAAGINSSSATDSTSTATGSIITSGGVGIAKAVFIGTTLNVTGASTMTGAIAVDSVTDSTSTTTGSIQTDGGVGIAKALFVGTTANIAGVTTVQAGTAALPAITTSGDTNTGIFFPAADTIAFAEGGAEAMRINSSGNVGIGTTSPLSQSKLTVAQDGTLTAGGLSIDQTNGSSNRAGGIFLTRQTDNRASIESDYFDGLIFSNKSGTGSLTERMRIPVLGGIQSVNSISVGNATPTTSGAGITFPATQSASSDVNTLDDYEEGSFTPTITAGAGSAGAYTTQIGKYTKIGNRCFCEISVACAKGTLTGQFVISSLPFAVSSNFSIGVSMWWNQANGVNTIAGLINGTTIVMYDCTSTGGFVNLTDANLTSVDFRTQFSYAV